MATVAKKWDAPHHHKAVFERMGRHPQPRKWKAGAPINTVDELLRVLGMGDRDMIWYKDRAVHAGYVGNWAYWTLIRHLKANHFRYALVRPEYYAWLQEELDHARTNLEF